MVHAVNEYIVRSRSAPCYSGRVDANIDVPLGVLVPCDHVPRRSWPLFRAKAMLGDLIAGFSSPGIHSHQEQLTA